MIGIDNIEEVTSFITNDASDYQIMEMVVTNRIPREVYNPERERQLWESLKQELRHNHDLSDIVGKDLFENFISEMGPVHQYGISSAKPILELQIKSGILPHLVEAVSGSNSTVADKIKNAPIAVKASIGLGIASLVALAAKKAYDKYFSQAGRMCKGKPDRDACLAYYKDQAIKAQLSKLQAGIARCKDQKCRDSLKAKIAGAQAKQL